MYAFISSVHRNGSKPTTIGSSTCKVKSDKSVKALTYTVQQYHITSDNLHAIQLLLNKQ